MFNLKKGEKMKTWSKIKINGDDVWTQTPKETKSWYNKLNKLYLVVFGKVYLSIYHLQN